MEKHQETGRQAIVMSVQIIKEHQFLAFQESGEPSTLKRNAEKWRNQIWKMASEVFVHVAAPRTKFSFETKL